MTSGAATPVVPNVCHIPVPPRGSVPVPYPITAPPIGSDVKAKVSGRGAVTSGKATGVSTGDAAGTALKVLSTVHTVRAIQHGLQVSGFSAGGAKLMASGEPPATPQDQVLLCATLTHAALQP
jgi:hypothetical protein